MGRGIVPRKPRPKSAYDFLGLLYCFIVLLCVCVVSWPGTIYLSICTISLVICYLVKFFFLFSVCYYQIGEIKGGAENAGQENDGQKSSREKLLDGDPAPHPSATISPRILFYLSFSCRLYNGFQDTVSFTVTTGLLGRLGLGLRIRVSILIIFTFFRNLLYSYYKLIQLL